MRAKTRELDADAPGEEAPYEPSPRERPILETYLQNLADAAPRMKVVDGDTVTPDHPEPAVGQVLLMSALGTTDHDFFGGIVRQLGEASACGGRVDERTLNFMLSVVKGIKPRDQVETMLAAQMAAVHVGTLASAQRLAFAGNPQQQDTAERAVNKLARTFATQMEALKRYRSGGPENVTVQHVSVSDGGQAIVGNVTQAPHATSSHATASPAAAPRATIPRSTRFAASPAASPESAMISLAPDDARLSMLSQPELAPAMVRRARKLGARPPA
jgi:hypothetical protein